MGPAAPSLASVHQTSFSDQTPPSRAMPEMDAERTGEAQAVETLKRHSAGHLWVWASSGQEATHMARGRPSPGTLVPAQGREGGTGGTQAHLESHQKISCKNKIPESQKALCQPSLTIFRRQTGWRACFPRSNHRSRGLWGKGLPPDHSAPLGSGLPVTGGEDTSPVWPPPQHPAEGLSPKAEGSKGQRSSGRGEDATSR